MSKWATYNRRSVVRRAGVSLLLIGAVFFMLRRFELSQVYHPSARMDAAPGDLGRPAEEVSLTTPDGMRLNAWLFPPDSGAGQESTMVLFCHGNGGNISHRLDLYSALLRTGVGVFSFDYRGYGKSQGTPGEAGTYTDAQAAFDWLVGRGYKANQIIALGESLGGGVAAELALRRPVAGLVLMSSFTSIPDIGAEIFPWLPVRWLGRIKYETLSKLPKISTPVMIMHSRDDDLIGFHHGQTNFAAAREPKLFREIRGTHNDPLLDPALFEASIRSFLELISR